MFLGLYKKCFPQTLSLHYQNGHCFQKVFLLVILKFYTKQCLKMRKTSAIENHNKNQGVLFKKIYQSHMWHIPSTYHRNKYFIKGFATKNGIYVPKQFSPKYIFYRLYSIFLTLTHCIKTFRFEISCIILCVQTITLFLKLTF